MFSRNHPLSVTERMLRDLEDRIAKCVAGLRREHTDPQRILGRLLGRRSDLASLRSSVRKESLAWSVYQAVSRVGIQGIVTYPASLIPATYPTQPLALGCLALFGCRFRG